MPSTTSSVRRTDGVSVVVPVRNGARWLVEVLDAVLAQDPGGALEVLVVDDGSTDGSRALLAAYARDRRVRVLDGPRRGAAAAINRGVADARHTLIAQIDQDVVPGPVWLRVLRRHLDDDSVAAAQGYYLTDREASVVARVMGLDLEQRYERIPGDVTDHVCTGNTLYRASALEAIGGFDESLGYGYDNDVSYRLARAGFRLILAREAISRHHWREGVAGYLAQQYGVGYGRLDVVSRHPGRFAGDAVSPPAMMIHPLACCAAIAAPMIGALAGVPAAGARAGWALLAALLLERAVAGLRAWRRFGDPAALAFPVFHLARDAAWIAALLAWTMRRAVRHPASPDHSMRPRETAGWSDEAV